MKEIIVIVMIVTMGIQSMQAREAAISGVDLAISADAIAVNFSRTEAGNHILALQIGVANRGDVSSEQDFKISLQDNHGNSLEGFWHSDFDGPLPIPAEAEEPSTMSIPWPVAGAACYYRFTAKIDSDGQIPESSEDNNTASLDYTLESQNIRIDSLSTVGTADGVETINVVIENNGCSPIVTPFALDIKDGAGNTGRQTIPALPPGKKTVVYDNWPSACSTADRTFTVTAVSDHQLRDWDATDNIGTFTAQNTTPDLALSASIAMDCTEDGKIRGAIVLLISNTSDIAVSKDFFISIDDGKGWKIEKRFQKDLGGRLPLPKGESREITVEWTRDFSIKPMIIDFPEMEIGVDSKDDIHECDGANNVLRLPYKLRIPNLNLVAFTPTCVTDDYYQVILVIENNGGADINNDFYISVTDNDGKKQIQTFTKIEGILPFLAGSRQTVLFDTWEVDQTPAILELECRLDFNRQLGELDANDNNMRGSLPVFDMEITDFKAETSTETAEGYRDIKGFFTVTVTNSGLNTIRDDFAVQVVDGQGWRTEKRFAGDLNGALPLGPGESKTVKIPWEHDFSTHPPAYTFKNISVIIDSQSDICECDGSNNQAFTHFQFLNTSLLLLLPLSQ